MIRVFPLLILLVACQAANLFSVSRDSFSDLQSQRPVQISGRIYDSEGKPISKVKITVFFRTSMASISTTYSDTDGSFSLAPTASNQSISELGLKCESERYRLCQLNGDDIFTKSNKIILYTPAEYNCQIADFYFQNSNPVGASYRYQEAIKLQPELRAANDGLGRSLELMGQYEQAIKVYQDFISKFPDSLAVPEFRARISDIQNKKR